MKITNKKTNQKPTASLATVPDVKPGLYEWPFAEYLRFNAVNKSVLDHLHPTPAHCAAYLKEPPRETPAMRLGKITHTSILEPDKARFTVKPKDFDGRKKQWKEWLAHQKGELITADEARAIEGMKAAVWAHPFAAAALKGALIERSTIGIHGGTGLLCKCRPDAIATGNVVADLKTCERAELRDFQRNVLNFRYHVQGAFYLDVLRSIGMERTAFVFICVEKDPPHGVMVWELDAVALEQGRREYQADLEVYARCQSMNHWPGYPIDVQTISLPDWYLVREKLAAA